MLVELNKGDDNYIQELENKFPNIFNIRSISNDFINNPFTKYLLYFFNNEIIGFINFYDIYNRIEIININILDNYKNKGYGSLLMEELIRYSIKNNKINITLEVRRDNIIAIHLYEKYGFINKAIRHNYYGKNIDGLLMEKELI